MSKKLWGALIIALIASWLGLKPGQHSTAHHNQTASQTVSATPRQTADSTNIAALTDPQKVAAWIHQNHRLPDYYIRKSEARRDGWEPSRSNLCDVLPGRAIGGDHFSNREGRLPDATGRRWFEADVNYRCGHRNADRLLYSSDGLVFVTTDHYRTFTRIP